MAPPTTAAPPVAVAASPIAPRPAPRRDPGKVFAALAAEQRRLDEHIRAEIEAEVRPVVLAKGSRRRAVQTELDELERGTGRFEKAPAGMAVRGLRQGREGAV